MTINKNNILKPIRPKRVGVALNLKKFSVSAKNKKLVDDLNLKIKPGEIHLLIGPNGAGKSTLLNALAGFNTDLKISAKEIKLFGQSILDISPEAKARAGLWLVPQHPVTIPGLPLLVLAKTAAEEIFGLKNVPNFIPFRAHLEKLAGELNLPLDILTRAVNEHASGGEKKKIELLFLQLFQPAVILLDEIDAGLDIDSLHLVQQTISQLKKNKAAIIVVSHSFCLGRLLKPNFVHFLKDGRLIQSGSSKLLAKIEKAGFKNF